MMSYDLSNLEIWKGYKPLFADPVTFGEIKHNKDLSMHGVCNSLKYGFCGKVLFTNKLFFLISFLKIMENTYLK